MQNTDQSIYLSLSEASRLLGVHNTTLRRWADAGTVPVYVTPGGHRRFALHDIEALSERKTLSGKALANAWARRAIERAREEMQRAELSPSWLAALDDEERESWRSVSMQLVGIVIRYVNIQDDDDETLLLTEARNIGSDYAARARARQIPLTTALEVALFFGESLVSAAMDMPEQDKLPPDVSAWLSRRISRVLNVVKLAVAAGYETEPPSPSDEV
jgi:excisionase family DNA binding protein